VYLHFVCLVTDFSLDAHSIVDQSNQRKKEKMKMKDPEKKEKIIKNAFMFFPLFLLWTTHVT